MQFTASQISQFLNGVVEGNADAGVVELAKIEDAKIGSLCFLSNPKYEHYLYTTKASVVIVANDFVPSYPFNTTLIRVQNPYSAFSLLLEKYNEQTQPQRRMGVEEPVFIHPSVKIGKDVFIGAFSYLSENVEIGDHVRIEAQVYIGKGSIIGNHTTLHPGVKIYHSCTIGNEVIIHSNTVIGSDGFGFAPQENGHYHKIAQVGNVLIEDNVEIGANAAIDRATLGATIIRRGAKLDNLVQIAHNVEVGSNTVIAAQTGVSGSTKIGDQAVLGGQVGVAGHLNIAKGTKIGAQSGVMNDLKEENGKWHGSPVQSYISWLKSSVLIRHLPQFEKRITELEILMKEKAFPEKNIE